MGYPLLNDELMWNTLTAPRSDSVKRLPGGASELFRVCVEYSTTRQQDLTNGVVINLPGEASPRVVFGSVRIVVQDERAQKFGMSAMGASALKLCGLCANILSFKSDQLPCAPGYFLPPTETDTISDSCSSTETFWKSNQSLVTLLVQETARPWPRSHQTPPSGSHQCARKPTWLWLPRGSWAYK